ncbi:MAG TPA: Gfo/Idh/MocA family oxidoreductase [Flavisolibacter sp.]|jgi:predicted dehydrogenase|nr:Gfo/Idh/MocA family oxidoreductase [Flavisolibacter sp.]
MIKAVILGCGNIAGGYDINSRPEDFYSHIKAYQSNSQVHVTAVYDPSPGVAQLFSQYWSIPRFYNDLSLMLTEERPEVASICSPNSYHCEQIEQCVSAGVHTILCEKPISYDIEIARGTIELCRSKNVSLVINYLRNWDQAFLELENILKQDEYPEFIQVHYSKGVFHNASHFINFFQRSLGDCTRVSVIRTEKEGLDALSDFELGFEKCARVLFVNHKATYKPITELDIYFPSQRIRVENGGQIFRYESYMTGEKWSKDGTIHTCMKEVINDVVEQALNRTPNPAWEKNLADTLKTTIICSKIVQN